MEQTVEDEVVTAVDVVRNLEDQEREALDLYPEEPDDCSYSKGYHTQAVYSCLDCTPDGNAGMCYSCQIRCHASHRIAELWTRRDFRCDCGNSKFSTPCSLETKKDPVNEKNHYNHNYANRYCFCDQYFDPFAPFPTMIKCVACEDWFHEACINEIPDLASWKHFVCANCTSQPSLSFLLQYSSEFVTRVHIHPIPEKSAEKEVDKESPPNKRRKIGPDTSDICKLDMDLSLTELRNVFLPKNYRSLLCRCAACEQRYKSSQLPEFFSLASKDTEDDEDTDAEGDDAKVEVDAETTTAGSNPSATPDQHEAAAIRTLHDLGVEALLQQPRDMTIEQLAIYEEMRRCVFHYLRLIQQCNRPVTQEDIASLFTFMKMSKRMKGSVELEDVTAFFNERESRRSSQ